MKQRLMNKLICPQIKETLQLNIINKKGIEIITGKLVNNRGNSYIIENGMPDMTFGDVMIGDAIFARNYYTSIADTYDENVHVTFELYNDTEEHTRNYMIDLLEIKEDDEILEVSAGTGRDSEIILTHMGKNGRLTLLDITPFMLYKARERLELDDRIDYVIGNACALPFRDNSFDKLYCFTGVGHFPDRRKAFKEMARVVKPGGKVVLSEKNVPPYLRNTEYGKICINNNPMFAQNLPLEDIPVEARELGIRWILGNVHYVIDYIVGEGEPKGNFDLELPGIRGGSFNTRYFGKLEGVSKETKELAKKANLKMYEEQGISMTEWLDSIILNEAKKVLMDKED